MMAKGATLGMGTGEPATSTPPTGSTGTAGIVMPGVMIAAKPLADKRPIAEKRTGARGRLIMAGHPWKPSNGNCKEPRSEDTVRVENQLTTTTQEQQTGSAEKTKRS